MAKEIERKFLIKKNQLPNEICKNGSKFVQGYLSSNPAVRVRLSNQGQANAQAWLTVKGSGFRIRNEFEYEIPVTDAEEMLELCTIKLAKIRYKLSIGEHIWEIDEFLDAHSGLWLAEIELTEENEMFIRPDWLGEEVTEDPRFTNVALAKSNCSPIS